MFALFTVVLTDYAAGMSQVKRVQSHVAAFTIKSKVLVRVG